MKKQALAKIAAAALGIAALFGGCPNDTPLGAQGCQAPFFWIKIYRMVAVT
jgi:hypothetical protein